MNLRSKVKNLLVALKCCRTFRVILHGKVYWGTMVTDEHTGKVKQVHNVTPFFLSIKNLPSKPLDFLYCLCHSWVSKSANRTPSFLLHSLREAGDDESLAIGRGWNHVFLTKCPLIPLSYMRHLCCMGKHLSPACQKVSILNLPNSIQSFS